MTTTLESAQSGLAAIVGPLRVRTDAEICSSLSVDGRTPKMAVYPSSAEQAAAVLHFAAEHDLAVIPCRNRTKLGIGNPPRRYDLALSLKEMNQVWYYEPADLTVSVEPGMKLADFQHFVGRDGLWLPLDVPGGGRATIGGILAANSSGPLRLRYGTPRDMVLGMKIATTEGKVIKTGGRVVKNVAGYDLAKLLIGSYGTLGIIVEASLKLFPLPAGRVTLVLQVGTTERAQDLRRRIMQSSFGPTRMVVLDAGAARVVREGAEIAKGRDGLEMWVEVSGSRRAMERCARGLEELGRTAGVESRRLENGDAERGWSRIADFQTLLAGSHPRCLILKAALPISSSEEFLSRAREITAKSQTVCIGQTGVGIIHVGVLDEVPTPESKGKVERLRSAARELRGVLTIEHCPVELKGPTDVWGPTRDDFEIMRKLKEAWDPKGILSPGRFVGGL